MSTASVLQLSCLPPAPDGSAVIHGVQACIQGEVVDTVHFREDGTNEFGAKATGRTALLAFLPLAMKLGMDIEVMDPVDPLTLMGLSEWQRLMACWHPTSLKRIEIQGHHALEIARLEPSANATALMGFSGGVDSCHTLWRHSARRKTSPVRVGAGLLVHGMDIPLADKSGFEGAKHHAKLMLEAHGARLLTVSTDLRKHESAYDLNWETHTHAILLAACLSLFEASFDATLIASTYPVDELELPWGSNPVSDCLLGGFKPLIHVGTDCNKRQKVEAFCSDRVFTDHLRVCWQGSRRDANCGRCFKCLATQACLWIGGVSSPGAFDRPAHVVDLKNIEIKNEVNHHLISDIHAAALASGRLDIAAALSHAMRFSKWQRQRRLRLLGLKSDKRKP